MAESIGGGDKSPLEWLDDVHRAVQALFELLWSQQEDHVVEIDLAVPSQDGKAAPSSSSQDSDSSQ